MTRRTALAGLAAAGAALATPSIARAAAPRIVTIGGGVTETVFALGRGRDVVGTDAASLFPHAAEALPKLGYAKNCDAGAALALKPDIVLVADDAGPRAALDELAASGARYVRLPEPRGLDDVVRGLVAIAEAIGEPARGRMLAEALAADLALIADGLKEVPARRRALALMGAPDAQVLIAAGHGSPPALALALAGAENAADALPGWAWIAPSAARALDPEAVVALSASSPIARERIVAAAGVRDTAAGRDGRVASVDAQAFTGFGPRTAQAVHAVARRIYPEIAFAPLPARPWTEVATASL